MTTDRTDNAMRTTGIALTEKELAILYSLVDAHCRELEQDGEKSLAAYVLREKITDTISRALNPFTTFSPVYVDAAFIQGVEAEVGELSSKWNSIPAERIIKSVLDIAAQRSTS